MCLFAVCLRTLVYGSLCILSHQPHYQTKILAGNHKFFPSPPKNPYDIELPLSSLILSLTI